jgi:hypothetical protein
LLPDGRDGKGQAASGHSISETALALQTGKFVIQKPRTVAKIPQPGFPQRL